MKEDQAQQIIIRLLTNWLSAEEKSDACAAGNWETAGLSDFDTRELVVRKVLELPARCRALVLACIDGGVPPQDLAAFLSTIFSWIDKKALSPKEANAAISRFCSESHIEWDRTPAGGYKIRLTLDGPELTH